MTDWKTDGRPLVEAVEDAGVGPDLGVERGALAVEDAHDRPRARPDPDRRAELEALVGAAGTLADDGFGQPRPQEAALHHLHVVPHLEDVRRHASDLHVRVGVALLQGQGGDHHDLRADERPRRGARDLRRVLHEAHVVHEHHARHLGVGPGALHDRVLREARGRDRGLEAAGEREHRHEDAHRARDAEDGDHGGGPARGGAAQVVGERDGHGQTLRSASTTLRRIAPIAGRTPARKPVPSAATALRRGARRRRGTAAAGRS